MVYNGRCRASSVWLGLSKSESKQSQMHVHIKCIYDRRPMLSLLKLLTLRAARSTSRIQPMLSLLKLLTLRAARSTSRIQPMLSLLKLLTVRAARSTSRIQPLRLRSHLPVFYSPLPLPSSIGRLLQTNL